MRILAHVFSITFCFGAFAGSVHAQLSDSDGSARWVASMIASDGKGSAEEYRDYSKRLARTMSQYPAAVQKKILGFLPPASGDVEYAEQVNASGGNNIPSASAALANPALSSDEVFDALLNQSPLSDGDILKMLEREPALEKEHLDDLLKAQGKLTQGSLMSALASPRLKLGQAELKALLISQSPLDKSVLKKVETTSNLSRGDISEVLAAQ
jgi:hypothetical protein